MKASRNEFCPWAVNFCTSCWICLQTCLLQVWPSKYKCLWMCLGTVPIWERVFFNPMIDLPHELTLKRYVIPHTTPTVGSPATGETECIRLHLLYIGPSGRVVCVYLYYGWWSSFWTLGRPSLQLASLLCLCIDVFLLWTTGHGFDGCSNVPPPSLLSLHLL